MGYTNKTSHYELPQWIAGDKPSWLGDMNTAMLNIDTAISSADASASAAESSAAAANAQVQAQEAKITKNTTDIQALTGELADVSGVASAALPKNGGTMTGTLTLAGAPTQDLQAATKKYVDDHSVGATSMFTKTVNIEGGGIGSGGNANNAVVSYVFGDDLIASTFVSTFVIGLYTFVPLIKVAGNLFSLSANTTPTQLDQLKTVPCAGTFKKNDTITAMVIMAFYDGANTVFCARATESVTESIKGSTAHGYILSAL